MRIGDVIAMTALVICVLIALIIAANLQTVGNSTKIRQVTGMSSADNASAAQYNATVDTLFTNTWTGLTLASVGIIISAAVGILALVLSTLGRAGAGGVA